MDRHLYFNAQDNLQPGLCFHCCLAEHQYAYKLETLSGVATVSIHRNVLRQENSIHLAPW